MKAKLICLLFGFLTGSLYAQSFNYEEVTLKYRLPAKTPFTSDFKTITVRFQGEEYLKKYGILPAELLAGDFKFIRFENVPEHGDLHLDVTLGMPEYLGAVKERYTKKENDVDVVYYRYKGSIITPISYVLRDGARNVIEEKITYSAGDHHTFYSSSNRSSSALDIAWEEGKNIVVTQNMKDILLFALGKTVGGIRDRFDDQIIDARVTMYDIKKPEKIKAEFLNTAFAKIKSELASTPVITDWDEAQKTEIKNLLIKGTKFSTDDKDQVVAYAIAHFNLAVLHLYWGDIATAKSHLTKGKLSDRKNWEFGQLEEKINNLSGRGIADEFSSKAYAGTYQEGSDAKLPGTKAVESNSISEDFSDKKPKSIDTVLVKNGDMIIGYVTTVHAYRGAGPDKIHDLTHLMINPTNMSQEEIKVPAEEIVYIRHKNNYLVPLVTKLAIYEFTHLYEPLKLSKDEKLALMRTGYHESMPYELSSTSNRAYAFTYFNKPDKSEYEILAVSGGTRYLLGINGPLAKDFEFCSTIVNKAKNKHYEVEENSLTELVADYDGCVK